MPNHVTNVVKIIGEKEKVEEMLKAIQDDECGRGTIDFNKIIPMPESLNIISGTQTDRGLEFYKSFVDVYTLMGTRKGLDLLNIPEESEKAFLKARTDIDAETFELGKKAYKNILQYGSPDWYDWSIKNWGTKWNAYGFDEYTPKDVSGTDPTVTFQTAWSAPHPILQKLSEMYPDIYFEHAWADENIGYNCGRKIYENGECVQEYYPDGVEAYRFANEVWGFEDEDEEMCEETDEEIGEQTL